MNTDYNSTKTSFELLSSRELQVVDLLSRGLSEKEIADKLCISKNTINNHLSKIRTKCNVTKNTELIIWYICYIKKIKFDLAEIKSKGIKGLLK